MQDTQTVITEPDVTIRPLRLSDAEAVQLYASDNRVACTTTIPQPYPEDGGETFVKQAVEACANEEAFYFAILADGELIGAIDLRSIESESVPSNVVMRLPPPTGVRGIATKAVALALR